MQDRAIAAIGRLQLKQKDDLEPWQLYAESIKPGLSHTMIVADFALRRDGTVVYTGVDTMAASDKNYMTYGYRKGSARGGDITLTTKFGDFTKKMNTLVQNQLPALVAVAEKVAPKEAGLFRGLKKAFEQDQDTILKGLTAQYDGLTDKKEQNKAGFTVRIAEPDGTQRLLTHYKTVQQQLEGHGLTSKYDKYSKKSLAKKKVCSVCREQRPEVYGFASPFKYATVDKPGFVSGFFDQRRNWANYPVCKACALEMEMGKTYVVNELQRRFHHRNFYMIPKAVMPMDEETLSYALDLVADLKDPEKKDSRVLTEEELVELAKDEDNRFTLNLLFYEENQTTKAITIKLMLEEILPSRFRLMFDTIPNAINGHALYKGARYDAKTKTTSDLRFNFGYLYSFWRGNDYYAITQKVFKSEQIDRAEFFARVMQRIREQHANALTGKLHENTRTTVLKAHIVMRYLQRLGVLQDMVAETMNDSISTKYTMSERKKRAFDMAKFEAFLEEKGDFLTTKEHQGVFAVGVLIRLLINIQKRELNNTPFAKKFKGYHLNYQDIMRLYMDTLDKLTQYQHFYIYNELREFIGENFALRVNQLKTKDPNELSFYLVAGLELGQHFRTDPEDADTHEIETEIA
ncbi:MAG: type I-B CRISPR-associated protein Cas8b/Csh1 [Cyclobacteriaceae bacterium]